MARYSFDHSRKFINPYNFVSVSQKVDRTKLDRGNISGVISCRLKIKEALCIPDYENEDEHSMGFYSVNGVPTIPGSEIRGCVRSVYEAVTNSCFSVINDNILSARKSRPETGVNPGLLIWSEKEGIWKLFSAEKFKEKPSNKTSVERVWYMKDNDGKYSAKISYFVPLAELDVFRLDIAVENLIENYAIFIENNEGKIKLPNGKQITLEEFYTERTPQKIDGKYYPVFYKFKYNPQMKKDSNILEFFSPASISRMVFKKRTEDILGNLKKCSGENEIYCPACALFGTITDNGNIASRVRFDSAIPVSDRSVSISENYKILPILLSPRISSKEFYFSRQNNKKYTDVEEWFYDDNNIVVRGRKFYFHSKPRYEEKVEFEKLQSKVKIAQDGSEFKFNVYVDNITKKELNELLWSLTLGDNDMNSQYMHKLGYAKPVGLGSVKIVIDSVKTRTFNADENEYKVSDYTFEIDDSMISNSNSLNEIKAITRYDLTSGKTVSYPKAYDKNGKEIASHTWFSSNRYMKKQEGFINPKTGKPKIKNIPSYKNVLPLIIDDANQLELPVAKENENYQKNKGEHKRFSNSKNKRNNRYYQ